ncbi:hypothetical protein HMPREF3034_02380, partial [Prevotella sp. DNF00663]
REYINFDTPSSSNLIPVLFQGEGEYIELPDSRDVRLKVFVLRGQLYAMSSK